MTIHKEGKKIILFTALATAVILYLTYYFLRDNQFVYCTLNIIFLLLFIFSVSFFRKPKRNIIEIDENLIYAPADGKIVAIEKTLIDEFLNEERIQVSVFMSPFNVHINWYPISGIIKYFKHHSGNHLVAWHPKSSCENERTTIVIEAKNKKSILMRQIAGAMARRIVAYSVNDGEIKQGEELGFIKFGSRVDLFLPVDVKIKVNLDQKVTGNRTVIAEF